MIHTGRDLRRSLVQPPTQSMPSLLRVFSQVNTWTQNQKYLTKYKYWEVIQKPQLEKYSEFQIVILSPQEETSTSRGSERKRSTTPSPRFHLSKITTHLSVEFDSQDGVGVTVVANLCPLLKVTNFQLAWSFKANYGHQTAGEEPLHNAHIFCVSWGITATREKHRGRFQGRRMMHINRKYCLRKS